MITLSENEKMGRSDVLVMIKLTPRQAKWLEARQRRLVAVHEAGHKVIARELEIPEIGAVINRRAGSDPLEHKLWTGEHRADVRGCSKRELAMYSAAGMVAEACWDRITALNIDWDDPDIMSESDWAGTGCEPGQPNTFLESAVDAVFVLLNRRTGRLWPRLILEARWLILRWR